MISLAQEFDGSRAGEHIGPGAEKRFFADGRKTKRNDSSCRWRTFVGNAKGTTPTDRHSFTAAIFLGHRHGFGETEVQDLREEA